MTDEQSRRKRLYLYVLEWPMGKLHIEGYAGKIKYAQLLHDASEVRFIGLHEWQMPLSGIKDGTLTLNLPVL